MTKQGRHISDDEIIKGIQEGKQRLLDDFYLHHITEFSNWAKKQFNVNTEESTDIYQDAVIILYEQIVSGKLTSLKSSLKTYLFSIGKNLIYRKFYKDRKVQDNSEELYNLELEKMYEDKEKAEEINDFEEIALAEIQKLKEPCKTVLELFYFKKLSLSDIAEQLGYKNQNVMKNKKMRCLQTLRKMVLEKVKEYNVRGYVK